MIIAVLSILLVMVTAGLGAQIHCDAFAKVWGQPRIRSVDSFNGFTCFSEENTFSAFRLDTNFVMLVLPDARISCLRFAPEYYCEIQEQSGKTFANTIDQEFFFHLLFLNSL